MAVTSFNTHPSIRLVALYEASSMAADAVVEMIEVPAGYRVMRAHLQFDDLGTGTTMDVGYLLEDDTAAVDAFIDGADTATAAGTATYQPAADAKGYLFTQPGSITIKNLGASASGSIRLEVDLKADYDSAS